MTKPMTVAERLEAIAMYESGVRMNEIADKFGRERNTIRALVKRAGVVRRPRGWRPEGYVHRGGRRKDDPRYAQ